MLTQSWMICMWRIVWPKLVFSSHVNSLAARFSGGRKKRGGNRDEVFRDQQRDVVVVFWDSADMKLES